MLARIKSEYRRLKDGAPGRRFLDHYVRTRNREGARGSEWRTAGFLGVGVVLLVAGLLLSVPPGVPGFLLWVPGLSVIAARSKRIAILLDRLEAGLRRAWARLRGRHVRTALMEQTMPPDLADALLVLARTPATLHALLGGLTPAWLHADEGPDTFSAFENLAHLVHGERSDWIPRSRIILAQAGDRRFAPFDRFAHREESAGKSTDALLQEFADLRAANLATLRGWQLTDAELALTGEHPALGTVTLRQLLSAWVAHDLGHLAQIARVMAKRYRDAVGPWRAYLPILDR